MYRQVESNVLQETEKKVWIFLKKHMIYAYPFQEVPYVLTQKKWYKPGET